MIPMSLVKPRLASRLAVGLALSPALLVVVVVYVGCTAWTTWISFTASRMLPSSSFVGLRQYASLVANERWQVSVVNLAVFGALFMVASLLLGFLLAVMIDQRVRAENLLRSIFLYPFSMSFIVDGLPPWRVYLSIVIPMLGASFATASVLLATSAVRLYDLSVAMTKGGPGLASEVPAKFVMDHLFERGNLGLATAAATSMLITVAAVVVPFLYWQSRRRGGRSLA